MLDFALLHGVKFLCKEYNKRTPQEWKEYAMGMISQYEELHGEKKLADRVSREGITMGFVISQLGPIIKLSKRHEFRKYTPYDLNTLCKNRFELLAFISIHQGDRIAINNYISHNAILRKDCKKIYKTLEKMCPSAISLDLPSFIREAESSLYDNHPSQ